MPGPLKPLEGDPEPFYRRLGGPQGQSGKVQNISPPSAFGPWTIQSVASRYTDFVNPPPHISKGKRLEWESSYVCLRTTPWRFGGLVPCILRLRTWWISVVNFMPWPLYTWWKLPCAHCIGVFVGPIATGYGREQKNVFTSWEFNPSSLVIQLVA